MYKLVDYIISLTNLYGLVHKDKVLEIFNLQNEEKIDIEALNSIMRNSPADLAKNFVEINGDYFVHDTIIEFDEFDEQLKQRKGKPFYIPPQDELLKYKDDAYFEVSEQYKRLLSYLTENIFDGDELAAEMLCEDIQSICQFGFSIQEIIDEFNIRGVDFKSEKQFNKVIQLIVDLANNTRIWENNGHTPKEIFEKYEKPYLRPLPDKPFSLRRADIFDFQTGKKVGRNDPCPCGSGKKYKKCCLGKEDLD
ncbi:MAG: hypothetical protein GXZ09_10570 [Syntrophomonadaceae bacterium]|jgi:hypothetical protein|nr:hypothetical protein [Syntrophomonadaceae bacterium]